MTVAYIVIEQTAYSFDKPYSYLVPEALSSSALPGCRVVIPFGKGNTRRQGLILSVENTDRLPDGLKAIEGVLDTEPVLNEEMLGMCEWMHEHLFCTYFDAIRAALPAGINFRVSEVFSKGQAPLGGEYDELDRFFKNNPVASRETLLGTFDFLSDQKIAAMVKAGQLTKAGSAVRQMKDATMKTVRALVSSDDLPSYKLTDKQREIVSLVCDVGTVSVKELLYFTGVSASVVGALQKKGIVELFDQERYRSPAPIPTVSDEPKEIILTDEQTKAYQTLCGLYDAEEGAAALLYGVTGSGKTSVFLKLADKAVSENKGVIIMVPEISLTPQTVSVFGKRYGKKVAVFHSAMSLGQRMDEWKRVKNGEATVAIGTRSAIFAQVKNLSLIVIDEEQEHTYKSEKSPRFHARDLARYRAAYHKGLLILASATPSVETYAAAKSGKYTLCTLSARYGSAVLPEVHTVDMRREILGGNAGALSRPLNTAILQALESGKQAIVLLNRRGHNTYVSCPTCGYVASCPNCSVSMTYHSANRRLMCHYCGYSEPVAQACPSCGGKLRFMGIGTQRVEEELKVNFPGANILRLDADSTSGRGAFAEYLDDFAAGKYDIMLGTQMVAKGLDFPGVTVVGVLGADSAMNSEDYRSFERSFSLLTQVFGRAGRGTEKGIAIIQTVDPDSNLIRLAAKQDYDSFYNEEIMTRRLTVYPPYCDIVVIGVHSTSKAAAQDTANTLFGNIKTLVSNEYNDIKLIVLGPSPASMPRVNNKYRFRLIIKAKNSARFRAMIRKAVDIKTDRDTGIFVDINPETIL